MRGGRRRGGRAHRAAAGAFRIGNTVGAALTARRPLGAAETPILAIGGLILVLLGVLAAWQPRAVAYPIAGAAIWLGLSLAGAAWRTRRPD
jgi:cardiolipin synthase